MDNLKEEKWFGGFFDGEGYCSFSSGYPLIGINNTSPLAISRCMSVLIKNSINPKINERLKSSKSSKKKRWDIYLSSKNEVEKMANLLEKFVYGKKTQINFIINKDKYNIDFNKNMQILNQTNNIIILDIEKLKSKLNFDISFFNTNEIQIYNPTNTNIDISDFNDVDYISGIIDAEGTIGMNKRQNKYRNTDRYTPIVSIVNTNKEIISRYVSTLKNNNIGFHVQTRIPTERNRIRWDVSVSGISRINTFCNLLDNCLVVKKQQLELLHTYCKNRLNSPKSELNLIGEEYKRAIETLNR